MITTASFFRLSTHVSTADLGVSGDGQRNKIEKDVGAVAPMPEFLRAVEWPDFPGPCFCERPFPWKETSNVLIYIVDSPSPYPLVLLFFMNPCPDRPDLGRFTLVDRRSTQKVDNHYYRDDKYYARGYLCNGRKTHIHRRSAWG